MEIKMDDLSCDVLVIGAGPAGLAAGVYCGRAGRNTIILEGKEPSALYKTKEISNYPGYEKIQGPKLLEILRKHAEAHQTVKIINGDVISLMVGMGMNMISTRSANITADAIIIATGRGIRKEVIKGESDLIGYGVSYCALCDGPIYREKVVYLYGSDEEVIEDALTLQQMGCLTNIITNVPMGELPEIIHEAEAKGIKVLDNSEIEEVIGDSQGLIQKIRIKSKDTDEIQELELACLFILSHIPSNSIFKKAGIELDERGNIKVNEEQETNIKSVFAAGDVTGGLFQVVFATAEGARAGINAAKYIRQLKKSS